LLEIIQTTVKEINTDNDKSAKKTLWMRPKESMNRCRTCALG